MRTAGLKMAFWHVLTTTKGKTKAKKVPQAQPWPAKTELQGQGYQSQAELRHKVLQTVEAKFKFAICNHFAKITIALIFWKSLKTEKIV